MYVLCCVCLFFRVLRVSVSLLCVLLFCLRLSFVWLFYFLVFVVCNVCCVAVLCVCCVSCVCVILYSC